MASTLTLLPADLGGVGSGSWQSIVRDVIAVGVTLWAATVLWVVIDARRRLVSLPGQAAAACLAVVLPFFGALLYRIVRPADLHAETRIRELEHELLLSELSGRRVCAHRAAPIAPDFVACPVCGTQLRHRCEACGGVLELSWALCPFCGDAQVEADEAGWAAANGNGGSRTRRRSRRRIRA
jgi:RNA polymerase subunit RPABC4/transcription elongation factor Spt4